MTRKVKRHNFPHYLSLPPPVASIVKLVDYIFRGSDCAASQLGITVSTTIKGTLGFSRTIILHSPFFLGTGSLLVIGKVTLVINSAIVDEVNDLGRCCRGEEGRSEGETMTIVRYDDI